MSQAAGIITYGTKGEAGFDVSGGIMRAGVWVCGAELSVGHLVCVIH